MNLRKIRILLYLDRESARDQCNPTLLPTLLLPTSLLNLILCLWITLRAAGVEGTGTEACWSEEGASWPLCRRCFGALWASGSQRPRTDQSWQVRLSSSFSAPFFSGGIWSALKETHSGLSLCCQLCIKYDGLLEVSSGVCFWRSVTETPFSLLSREKVPVHVVVDPVLGKVLRPHQREVTWWSSSGIYWFKVKESWDDMDADGGLLSPGFSLSCWKMFDVSGTDLVISCSKIKVHISTDPPTC